MITRQPSFLLRVLDALNALENAAERGCSAKEITEYLCNNYKCDGNVHATVELQVQTSLNRALEQGMVEKDNGSKYTLVPSVVHFMKSCLPVSVLRRRTIKGCEILKKAPNRNQEVRPLKESSKKKSTRKLNKQARRNRRQSIQKTTKRMEAVKKMAPNSNSSRRAGYVSSTGKSKQTNSTAGKQTGVKQKHLYAAALKQLRKGEVNAKPSFSFIKCPDCPRQIVLQKIGVCSDCSRKFIIAKKRL